MIIHVEKRYKLHLFIYSLLSIQLFVFAPVEFINKFLAAAISLCVLLHLKEIRVEVKHLRQAVIFTLASAYLALAFFGYDLFTNSIKARPLIALLYYGLGFMWTSYVLQSVLDLIKSFENIRNRFSVSSDGKYWQKWLVLFAIMFTIFIIWQRAYNPVILSPDSYTYINGWRFDRYLYFRPPVFAFLVNLICRLAPTKPEIQWVVFVQIFYFSALLSTVLMYFHNKWIRFKYMVLVAVILPLIPSFGLHTITIWLDIPCGAAVLWFTYVLVRVLDEVIINCTASSKQQLSFCLQLCVSMVAIYFVRLNSFLVFLVMTPVLALLFILKKQWNFLGTVAISVIIVLIIRFPGYSALNVQTPAISEHYKYFAGIHDIQATYYYGGELSEQTLTALKKYIPKLDDRENITFRDDWVHFEFYDLTGLNMGEFFSMYADGFIKNPLKMLKAMLLRCRADWVIDPKGSLNCINYTEIFDGSSKGDFEKIPADIGVYRKHNILTGIMDKYIAQMVYPIPAIFFWRFGFWTALMVVSAVPLILQKRYIWLLTYIPVFIYLASLLLSTCSTDYRYGLPIFFVGLFLPPAMLLLNRPDVGVADAAKKKRRRRA